MKMILHTAQRSMALAVLAVCLGGCSKSGPAVNRPTIFPTKGTVTYNGQPAKGVLVTFWPLPLGPNASLVKPQGLVQVDGSFVPLCYGEGGAAPGEYAITLRWAGEAGGIGPDLFEGRYYDAAKPVATVTIQAGENVIPPIALTGPPLDPRSKGGGKPDDAT